MVLREKRQNPVELVEGAGPAVNEHKRQDLLILAVWWHHMDEVHVQSCNEAKKHVKREKKNGGQIPKAKPALGSVVPSILVLKCGYLLSTATCFFQSNSCLQ